MGTPISVAVADLTHAGSEVDFVVGDSVAIEVKGSGRVSDRDLKGLRMFSEEVARIG